ncbi:hypothetical protein FB45DRAFT_1051262 [Roridomyces roridus]|uniref:Uncharacterized protein n=1 Tax=Roridomyces roridus TaxID=1738132 RepID=A0AAD7CE63_9AGAR|nr:hypothetical protein FB45DRAFT_1051262 [Roridomyces roridus]
MSVDAATHPAPTSSTAQSSPAVPPIDLRHMTSNTLLATDGRRVSQHLQAPRKGSRSPASIPSSPTSVHSSSSAIFERDIEPMHVSPSIPGLRKDPHRIPRAKNTEFIEQSVPSVLDSAASILTSMTSSEDGDSIAVIAPAQLPPGGLLDQGTVRSRGSGFASPIGSFRSRSPSPSPRAGNRTSLLLSIPSPQQLSPAPTSAPASAPPTARQFDTAVLATPISASLGESTYTTRSTKRLSFMSYTDLLSSTPSSTQPLSALTSPSSSPSHIPGVGVAIADATAMSVAGSAYTGSGAPSLRNFGLHGDEDRTMDDVGDTCLLVPFLILMFISIIPSVRPSIRSCTMLSHSNLFKPIMIMIPPYLLLTIFYDL